MTNFHPIILASASPRRRQLLEISGFHLIIQPSQIEEIRKSTETPIVYCQRLAREKAQAIVAQSKSKNTLVVAADTVVYIDQSIYEKPIDDQHAFEMLSALSKDWHHVVSAWYISSTDGDFVRSGHQISDVRFRKLEDKEILSYIATKEGRDKAGSYGIQGLGAALVEEIRGSYSNIVGLPLRDVVAAIREYHSTFFNQMIDKGTEFHG